MINNLIKLGATITQDLLFARYCYLCNASRPHHYPFCRHCIRQLTLTANHCLQCGIQLNQMRICGQCLYHSPFYNYCLPTFHYQDQVKDLIIQLKYHHKLYLAGPLALQMFHKLRKHYQQLEHNWPKAIMAVPLHTKKLKQRGFNQSLLLANALADLTNISNDSQLLIKTKPTQDQATLPLSERKTNVKNAYLIKTQVPSHIALIDDVMTSGETVNQIAKCLKKHGAHQVDVWCLARAYH